MGSNEKKRKTYAKNRRLGKSVGEERCLRTIVLATELYVLSLGKVTYPRYYDVSGSGRGEKWC